MARQLRPTPPTRTAVRRPPAYLPGAFLDLDEPMASYAKLPPEARRLMDRAKGVEGPSEPRKHHLVPRSYLARWAQAGKLRVTETTSRHSYLASPATAARETDFYRLDSPDLDPAEIPPLSFEVFLGEFEGEAVPAIDHLVAGRQPQDDPRGMLCLAWFMALQMTRGRSFRARLQEQLRFMTILQLPDTEERARLMLQDTGDAVTEDSVANLLTSVRMLKSGELVVEHQQAAMIQLAAESAQKLAPQLLFRQWLVYWTDCAQLITCDEPVVILNGPDADRRFIGGVGTADLVIFPLAPSALLVMVHPDVELHELALLPDLDPGEVSELNRELGAASHRWMIERSDRTQTLFIPLPPSQPALHQHVQAPVANEPGAMIHGFTSPTRWFSTRPAPPLPVERWWLAASNSISLSAD